MKRIAKIVGLIGGAIAIVWAMRDRFISVVTSREPQPPIFKTKPTSGATVDFIDGIGPIYSERLARAGLGTAEALANAGPDAVAEAASVSTSRAKTWIDLAKGH